MSPRFVRVIWALWVVGAMIFFYNRGALVGYEKGFSAGHNEACVGE